MEGDRDEHGKIFPWQPRIGAVEQQLSQGGAQFRMAMILETVDDLQQSPGINGGGAGDLERFGRRQAITAESVSPLPGPVGGSADGTQGRIYILDLSGAGLAKYPGRQLSRHPPAGLAPGGKEDINEAAPGPLPHLKAPRQAPG